LFHLVAHSFQDSLEIIYKRDFVALCRTWWLITVDSFLQYS
jgi:hypothetical protein